MLTGLHGKAMAYDGENRSLSVTWNGVETGYVYGADGMRLQQVTEVGTGAEDVITYLGPVEIRGDLSAPDSVLALPHASVRLVDGVANYFYADQLGTILAVTDASGVKARETANRSFGEIEREWTYDAAIWALDRTRTKLTNLRTSARRQTTTSTLSSPSQNYDSLKCAGVQITPVSESSGKDPRGVS